MQDYITKDYLKQLGIALDDSTADALISHLNDTVNERIGAEITEALNDEQLKELVVMQDTASDDELGAWVAKHVPDYEDIVQDNIDIAVGELAQSSDAINTSA